MANTFIIEERTLPKLSMPVDRKNRDRFYGLLLKREKFETSHRITGYKKILQYRFYGDTVKAKGENMEFEHLYNDALNVGFLGCGADAISERYTVTDLGVSYISAYLGLKL